MPRKRMRAFLTWACLSWACLATCAAAQCSKDQRDSNSSGILVTDVAITGTRTLSASELARITSQLTGSCFNDDADEMSERVRALFQDRGYFRVEVKNFSLKALDPLGNPKPVKIEAEVDEGQQYRLAKLDFLENHALSTATLRSVFPMKDGAIFSRSKVASGMEALRKEYVKGGFRDWVAIPDTELSSNATVALKITVTEGPQYHMGKLKIVAEKDLADRLGLAWTLDEGKVFDSTYIDRYIKDNRDLLPSGFSRDRFELAQDCPKALVDVRIKVTDDSAPSQSMQNVPCEKKEAATK